MPLWQGPADIESTQLLPDGSILVGSADASFTLLSPDGQVRLQQGSDALLPTDPTELYTDDTGARVWLRYGPAGDSYGFALDQLVRESRLQLGKPVADRLHPPRIEVPAAHTLSGWRRATMVTLDGAALPIRGEEPHSLAVSPDGRSFVLGTSGRCGASPLSAVLAPAIACCPRRSVRGTCPVRALRRRSPPALWP